MWISQRWPSHEVRKFLIISLIPVLRHYTAQILSIYRHLQQTVSFILATSLNFQTVIRPVKLRPWGQWY
jgi:hypothetical protein